MLEHRALSEALDRRLLERDDSPVHVDAKNLLKRKKIVCERVVHVDVDSILFLDGQKRPMTAWLNCEPSSGLASSCVRVWLEAGFAVEPGYVVDA
jgi:hypothetical protein